MSDLKITRDHARRMSESEHHDDCERIHRVVKVDRWLYAHGLDATLSCAREDGHEPHEWQGNSRGGDWSCPGLCGGCQTDSERALWRQIADEIDAYLTHDDEPLWEDA